MDRIGTRLLELLNAADRFPATLFFRNEAGDIRKLEGVIDVDVWFCVDPLGAVTKTRVSGLGGALEDGLADAASDLRFRPSTREGIPRTGVATLTILLSTDDQVIPEEIKRRGHGAEPVPWGENSDISQKGVEGRTAPGKEEQPLVVRGDVALNSGRAAHSLSLVALRRRD